MANSLIKTTLLIRPGSCLRPIIKPKSLIMAMGLISSPDKYMKKFNHRELVDSVIHSVAPYHQSSSLSSQSMMETDQNGLGIGPRAEMSPNDLKTIIKSNIGFSIALFIYSWVLRLCDQAVTISVT